MFIFMTSNMGSSLIRDRFDQLTDDNRERVVAETKSEVLDLLKKTIRPEFLNRIDEIIMFTPLTEQEIRQIVGLQLKGVERMAAANGIALQFSDAAVAYLAEKGYDPQFGARPVKRAIQ